MAILITGGAGYIGSHCVKYFQNKGEEVIVVDNLETGHKKSININHFYNIDIRDKEELNKVFKKHKIKAVIHFAANSIVSESIKNPYKYYHNNIYGTLNLLDTLKENNINKIIFSSTAAVYGNNNEPMNEESTINPNNTYGETKFAIERMMKWFDRAYNIKYVSLRYFNAAGAYNTGEIGECHNPETHLIPIILNNIIKKRYEINIFGDDYPTPDGTCIRDYIHVMDLASAHYNAYKYLSNGGSSDVFNLGSGRGYSVKEVIDISKKITKVNLKYRVIERREGDPEILVACSKKAKRVLNWETKFSDLDNIIKDAWNWHYKNPDGY